MTSIKYVCLSAAVLLLSAFTMGSTSQWSIDTDYSISFKTKKAKGEFKSFQGKITFDEQDLQHSKFDVEVTVASIKTGNWLKNRHAKGDDWFDADQYPTITFTSQQFAKTSNGYQVTGLLTMRGVAQEITMPFTFEDNIFRSTFTVDRTTYGIGGTTGMQGKVGHEVTLDIAVPVKK